MVRGFLVSAALHGAEPDVAAWSEDARLNLTCRMSQQLDDPRLVAALGRWAANADAALKNAEAWSGSSASGGVR